MDGANMNAQVCYFLVFPKFYRTVLCHVRVVDSLSVFKFLSVLNFVSQMQEKIILYI